RGHVVAAGVEPGDRLAVPVEDPGVLVGRKTGAAGDLGGPDRERAEGRRRDRAETRVGRVLGIAVEAVELGLALGEIEVDTGASKLVGTADALVKTRGVDGDPLGKLIDGCRANEVAAPLEGGKRARAR